MDFTEKFLKNLVGRRDLEDALERLDKLTQEEARMAIGEVLRLTQKVDDKVTGISNQVEGVNEGVESVDGKMEDVDKRVQGVDHKVQVIDDRVKQVDDRVGVVNDNVMLIVNGAGTCCSVSYTNLTLYWPGGEERSAVMERLVNTVDDMNRP